MPKSEADKHKETNLRFRVIAKVSLAFVLLIIRFYKYINIKKIKR